MPSYRGLPDPYPIAPVDHPLVGEVIVPGSKSITNRALLVAAAARGTTKLHGVLASDDTEAMIETLRALGIEIEHDEVACAAVVAGLGGAPDSRGARGVAGVVGVNVRKSGTTARFMVPFLSAGRGSFDVDAHEQMRLRPMDDLFAALRELGVRAEPLGKAGHLPLRIEATGIPGGEVEVSGSVSSQFLSGLLLAAPLAEGPLVINVTGQLVSIPYVDLTLSVMRSFGAVVDNQNYARLVIEPTGYTSPGNYAIEPDASAASYFFAAAVATGGRVRIMGLGAQAEQGDVRFADVLGELGATVSRSIDALEVSANGQLRGGVVNMGDCSDTAQTLAAIAPLAAGPISVTGIGFIRNKETDRIAGVVTELRRLGIAATEDEDGFTITPGTVQPAVVETYDDHRMAMSFSILGLAAPGVAIGNPGCVAKTFPTFFDVIERLRTAPSESDPRMQP